MQWLTSFIKFTLLALAVLVVWILGAGLFVVIAEALLPGTRLLQGSVTVMSLGGIPSPRNLHHLRRAPWEAPRRVDGEDWARYLAPAGE